MKISKVTIKKIENNADSRLRGYATIEIDEMFVVGDIRIIQGDDKLFIAMPSKKTQTGAFRDVCHPINQDARDLITEAIMTEFNK
jgi:stage V sporulation protein G